MLDAAAAAATATAVLEDAAAAATAAESLNMLRKTFAGLLVVVGFVVVGVALLLG